MEHISIKVTVFDRVYPVKVSIEEEGGVRRAAKIINEKIKAFQEVYMVRDKQDLLSMVVLYFAIEELKMAQKIIEEDENISQKVAELDSLVNRFFDSKNI